MLSYFDYASVPYITLSSILSSEARGHRHVLLKSLETRHFSSTKLFFLKTLVSTNAKVSFLEIQHKFELITQLPCLISTQSMIWKKISYSDHKTRWSLLDNRTRMHPYFCEVKFLSFQKEKEKQESTQTTSALLLSYLKRWLTVNGII